MAEALLNTMSRDQQEWENQMGYERFVHDCISREKYAFMKGEKKRAFETARKMLSDGMAVEIVAKYSGLTVDEVKVL